MYSEFPYLRIIYIYILYFIEIQNANYIFIWALIMKTRCLQPYKMLLNTKNDIYNNNNAPNIFCAL